MAFDAGYFSFYTRTDDDWARFYRRRGYYYRAMIGLLRRNHPAIGEMVEVGCGLGLFAHAVLADANPPAMRIGDISPYAIQVATAKLAGLPLVSAEILDAQNLAFPDDFVDAVVSFDVIEHLPQPNLFLAHAARMLRPGGVLLISTPNPDSFGCRIKEGRNGRPGNGLPWFARRDQTHVSIKSIEQWRELLRGVGLIPAFEGSDLLWDAPYVRGIPSFLQKLAFNGSQRVITRLFGILPWLKGENYVAVWRKPS